MADVNHNGRLLILVLAAAFAGTGCSTTAAGPTVTTANATATAGARPSREPANLVVLPQEQAVLDALTAAGVAVRLIGESKFAGDLGVMLPARVFIVTAGSHGADVLFLPAQSLGDIRVCAAPGTSARTRYTVSVNGQRVSGSDAGQLIYYLVNSQLFVIAYDTRTSDALQRGLGLTAARC